MFFIVYIAIGILILNAMLMAVFERIREFGVLKALGVGPCGVLRLILRRERHPDRRSPSWWA